MMASMLDMLKACSTATITTQLFKRNYRQQFLVGLSPLNPNAASFAGEAFTLRFIPSREDRDWDLGDLNKRGEDNIQWEAVEAIGAGQVLVIDSRNDPRAASAGMRRRSTCRDAHFIASSSGLVAMLKLST